MRARCLALGLVVTLTVMLGSGVTAQTARPASVRGQVIDETGASVPYAFVYERSTGAKTIADNEGRFTLSTEMGGAVSIGVRRIGYEPAESGFASSDAAKGVRIVLNRIQSTLTTIRVSEKSGYDEYLDRNGYYRRIAEKGSGTVISPDEVEKRNANELSQLLRNVPGVSVLSQGQRGQKRNVPLGRGKLCALGLVVDGQKIAYSSPPRENLQPRIPDPRTGRPIVSTTNNAGEPSVGVTTGFDEVVDIGQVKAIEVYPSVGSVPSSLQHFVDSCGLVVVWTKFQ